MGTIKMSGFKAIFSKITMIAEATIAINVEIIYFDLNFLRIFLSLALCMPSSMMYEPATIKAMPIQFFMEIVSLKIRTLKMTLKIKARFIRGATSEDSKCLKDCAKKIKKTVNNIEIVYNQSHVPIV